MKKDIWYFKYLNDDYYGRPVSGISDLNHAVCINIESETIYQNTVEDVYTTTEGIKISNLRWSIFDNENEAIVRYNEAIHRQINQCNAHISKLIEYRSELEKQLIKERAL